MLLASDALSKFDGSTAPPATPPTQQQSPPAHQAPVAEANPTPSAPQPTETASVPSQSAAVPVPEPQAAETPPARGSTEQEEEARQEGPAATNLNSAKAEAKLVKALDYLVAINDHSDNPGQKWFINESILASLTGCFRPAIKKFAQNHRSFINQANNTHGLGPGHNRAKARTNPDAIPLLVKNFKKTPWASRSRNTYKQGLYHTSNAHINCMKFVPNGNCCHKFKSIMQKAINESRSRRIKDVRIPGVPSPRDRILLDPQASLSVAL